MGEIFLHFLQLGLQEEDGSGCSTRVDWHVKGAGRRKWTGSKIGKGGAGWAGMEI
jgi:hypothetical protein